MSEGVRLDDRRLKQLIKAFGSNLPHARVGILSSSGKSSRASDGASNAEIGAAHEYGTEKVPMRSFLRMPITKMLAKYVERAGGFDEVKLREVIANATLIPWMTKIAISGEACVADAFASGGFGEWKPSNMDRKKVKQTLVETQQLRNSITSEVV